LPLPRQVLEAVGVEQRLVELAALTVVHLHERWVADRLFDSSTQRGRHWQSLRRGNTCERVFAVSCVWRLGSVYAGPARGEPGSWAHCRLRVGVAGGRASPGGGREPSRAGAVAPDLGASPLASCVVPGTFIPDSEVEPTLAVDPRRPRRLVAAWQQDRFVAPGGARSNVTARSRDGGRHWRRRLVPGVSRCTGGRLPAGQ
jgi:hypothetical protein